LLSLYIFSVRMLFVTCELSWTVYRGGAAQSVTVLKSHWVVSMQYIYLRCLSPLSTTVCLQGGPKNRYPVLFLG